MCEKIYFRSILVNVFQLYARIMTREVYSTDVLLKDAIYDQIHNIGPQQCYFECKRNAICKFVGYDRRQYICYPFNRNINATIVEPYDDFVLIYITSLEVCTVMKFELQRRLNSR